MTLSEQRRQFSKFFALLVLWAHTQGYDVAIDTTRRTTEEQARLVEQGASQTMASKHVSTAGAEAPQLVAGILPARLRRDGWTLDPQP